MKKEIKSRLKKWLITLESDIGVLKRAIELNRSYKDLNNIIQDISMEMGTIEAFISLSNNRYISKELKHYRELIDRYLEIEFKLTEFDKAIDQAKMKLNLEKEEYLNN